MRRWRPTLFVCIAALFGGPPWAHADDAADVARITKEVEPEMTAYVVCTRLAAQRLAFSDADPADVVVAAFAACEREWNELAKTYLQRDPTAPLEAIRNGLQHAGRPQLLLQVLQMRGASGSASGVASDSLVETARSAIASYKGTNAIKKMVAEYYVFGIEEGFGWANSSLVKRGATPLYCPPPKLAITADQTMTILEKFLTEDADAYISGLPPGIVLLLALERTFPCAH